MVQPRAIRQRNRPATIATATIATWAGRELEDALRTLGFRSVTILRPSVLLGDRHEARFGEEVAKRFGQFFPGQWRPVHARDVAKALVRSAKEDVPGLHIIESSKIVPYARGLS